MKRVKQIVMMAFASLLAQCVWAAGGVISINFNAGQGNGTADSGMVHVPADAWMNVTNASNNRAGNNMKYWDGTETVDGPSTMHITWEGSSNYQYTDGVTDPILKGYIDDGQNTTVSITGLPFEKYDVYLICATDTENATFNKWTVNETDYAGYGEGSSAWGRTRHSVCERGINVIKVSDQTGDLSITGAGKNGNTRGTIAAIQVVENTDADLADADFLFKGNTRTFSNATGSTWFNSWGGETLNTSYMAVGPGDMGLVSVAYGSKTLQPWKGFTFPSAFTFAIYTDLSLIKNPAENKKQILWAIGNGNSAGNGMIILSRKGDKVVLDATGSDSVEASMPTDGGYHLYTVTLSSAGIALAIDDGTPVTHAGTYNVAQYGFQVASVYGSMVSGYEKPDVLPIAALVGYSKVLTAAEIKTLAKRYPATHVACAAKPGNEATAYTFAENGGEVYAGTMNQLTYMRVDRGTLYVPAGQTYTVVAARFGNAQGETQNFGLELDGTMVMSGTSTSSGSGSGGIRANVLADVGGILFGEWEGIGTFNIRGTLNASKAWCQLALDANAQTYNVSGTWTAKGIQANKGSKARTSHTINLTDSGKIVSSAALNNGTLVANIDSGCVLETTYTADTNMSSADFSKITGSGTLKFSGNKYAVLPTDPTKYFADTLEVANNLENGIVIPQTSEVTIGSLSGNGTFRYDLGSNLRTLVVKQSKDTTWSGGIFSSQGHSSNDRALNIVVKSENDSVLTISGTVNGPASSTLTAGEGGTIKITGSCTGTGVVLDGGKLQSIGFNSAHGTMVKSLKLLKDGSYEWVEGSSTQIGIGANAQASTLDLDGHKITFTGKGTEQYDRVYLDKTTIPNAGTIEVTKGRLFIHCTVPTFPEGTKLIIGQNATIEVAGEIADKTMTVTELEYNGTVAAPANEAPTMVVTSKFSGTGSIQKLTLGDGAEVSGSATVTTTAAAQGTVKLTDGATLTVPTAFTAGTVTSGVDTKKVATKTVEGKTVYGLVDKNPEPVVPEEGTGTFPEGTVITKPDGTTVSGSTLPEVTGTYTVQAMKDGFPVGDPESFGVIVTTNETASVKRPVVVAVPFAGATVGNIVKTTNLTEGDELMALEGANYRYWTLTSAKKWVPNTTVLAEGLDEGAEADAVSLARGTAIWVVTADKVVTQGKSATTPTPELPTTATTTYLLANPTMAAYTVPVAQAAKDDQVVLPGSSTRYTVIETAGGEKAWKCTKSVPVVIPGLGVSGSEEQVSDEVPSIGVGKGFWFLKK